MSPKFSNNYYVVEITEEIDGKKIVLVPFCWISNNRTFFLVPPYDDDDLDLIESFLKIKAKALTN